MSAPTLTQMVHELVEPSIQRTKLPDGTVEHRVSAPSLIDQLSSREPSSGEGVRRGFGSRPAAALEAIDTAKRIDAEAREWCRWLCVSDTGKPGTVIRRMYSMTPQMETPVLDLVTSDVTRWWTAARVCTGWDTPPRQINGHCPACDEPERGTIRVRLDEWLAVCCKCGSVWDKATIGILGQAVRHRNGEAA